MKNNVEKVLISSLFLLFIGLSSFFSILIYKQVSEPEIKYVEVEKIVEKEVEKIVEKEIIIEKTLKEYMSEYYQAPLDEPIWLSSSAGPRTLEVTNDAFHRGDDLVTSNKKAKIKAAADGIVVEHWPAPNGYFKGHPTYGGYIILKHDNGTYTAYAHMSNTFVKHGQTVSKGETIGIIGSTGISTGIHLHFEIIPVPNKFIDINV